MRVCARARASARTPTVRMRDISLEEEVAARAGTCDRLPPLSSPSLPPLLGSVQRRRLGRIGPSCSAFASPPAVRDPLITTLNIAAFLFSFPFFCPGAGDAERFLGADCLWKKWERSLLTVGGVER